MSTETIFRAHVYGADIRSPCSEPAIVKMIVEMLLGSTNDIFGRNDKPLGKLCDSINQRTTSGNVQVQVFNLTHYGLHVKVDGLSQPLVQGILKWFGQFGSHMYLCRQFSSASNNHAEAIHQRTELTSAVLDTLKSSICDLLSAVEEALCDFEQKVLELPLSGAKATQHKQLAYNQHITLIVLYQRCLQWQTLFQSLAGIVCSAMPIDALQLPAAHNIGEIKSAASTMNNEPDRALSSVFEKVTVRGILQDVGEMIQVGGLVDIHRSMRLVTGGIKSSRNKSGFTSLDFTGQIPEDKATLLSPIRRIAPPADASLSLQLRELHQSGYYLYSKLFFSSMLEKYLTNLVAMVWQQQQQQQLPAHAGFMAASANASANASVSGSSGGSVCTTPMAQRSLYSLPSTPDGTLGQSRQSTPLPSRPAHVRSDAAPLNRDAAAVEAVLQRWAPQHTAGNSTLASRQKHKRSLALLRHTCTVLQFFIYWFRNCSLLLRFL